MPEPRAVLGVVLGVVLALLAACGGTAEPSTTADGRATYYGLWLDQDPYAVPDVTLTSTRGGAAGEPYALVGDTTSDLTLVFFGYSNCPDICQMVLANLANALARLDDADRERVDVLFVTTDPARDDVATLRTYLGRFDPAFVGITGDLSTLKEAGAGFHVYFDEGVPLPSGGYDVTHSDQVYAVTSDDTVPLLWTRETSPHEFATDVLTLLDADSA